MVQQRKTIMVCNRFSNSNSIILVFLLATPFNAKAQQHIQKFNTHTPNTMNFSTPQQQHSLASSQWTDPNHPAIQTQHQPSRAINGMQSMPMQHPTPLSNT